MTETLTTHADLDWWDEAIDGITTEINVLKPSQWAEQNRYLPPSVTPLPGPFSFKVMPFIREILDNFDIRSPIHEVNFMKGSQLAWTTGVLENVVGYSISVVKSAPMMWLTADAELAQLRMDQNVTPMIQQSGLEEHLQSSDDISGKKQAKTSKKIEWSGGGYILPYGAQNANKMRQTSVKFMLMDEVDGYPLTIPRVGEPSKEASSRCKGYWDVRKILRGSTPLLTSDTRIGKYFKEGDQRYYYVNCLKCGGEQRLRFSGTNESGHDYGLVYELDDDGNLKPETVRYKCKHCGHEHKESDKMRLFAEDNAQWKPTATPKAPDIRSYHLSSLYSPSLMYKWSQCVQAYLDGFDPRENKVRDTGAWQYFYNHVLGEPFSVRSNKLKFEVVSMHRRHQYMMGQIPNNFARQFCQGPICILTCAVDVHKTHLDVAVIGWARGERAFLVDEWTLKGDCEQLDTDPWNRLREIVESKTYTDGDRTYNIQLTFVDSGYNTDRVTEFCAEYEQGVIPIMGTPTRGTQRQLKEFTQFTSSMGTLGYSIYVDTFKERWHASLRREWDGMKVQPSRHFNCPINCPDQRLKELTTEYKVQKINKETNQSEGWAWHRPSGAPNEMWDLLVYNTCALSVIAHEYCVEQMGMEEVDWFMFWDYAESAEGLYFN